MKFGVSVSTGIHAPASGADEADHVVRLALAAEQAGFDSVWAADRTVYPADIVARYPDRFGPAGSDPRGQNVLEAVTTLAYLAGVTSTVRLGFSVLVLPFRDPVLNAKMVTTLDVLSGGRLIYGIGIGWMPEEFRAMRAPMRHRGAVTDEHLEMFKALCSQEAPEFKGAHFSTSGMTFFPRPKQQPHPPIWVGGRSKAAMRRAARLGDGWLPNGILPTELAAMRLKLRRMCEQNGRNPDDVGIGVCAAVRIGDLHSTQDGARVPFSGDIAAFANDVGSYREAGVELLVLSVAAPDTDATIDAVKRFAADVITRA